MTKRLVVTAGPTREWLDPVRYISNPSSGKMGVAIADAAEIAGYDVVCVHGPVNDDIISNKGYRTVGVESTGEMLQAVLNNLTPGGILIMAAAPADYTPVTPFHSKIKKGASNLMVEFKRTPDILKEVGVRRERGDFPGLYLAGFAAETDNIEEYAMKKIGEKKLDIIFANDVGQADAGFGVDTNELTAWYPDGSSLYLGAMSKTGLARKILETIEKHQGE